MSKVRRQARKTARQTKRATRKTARVTKRTERKAARQNKRAPGKGSTRPTPKGLADLTSAPGMKEAAGGPSLNEIATGGVTPGEVPATAKDTAGPGPISGGLSGIQENGPFQFSKEKPMFDPPGADLAPSQEPEPDEPETQEDEPQDDEPQEEQQDDGEGFSNIIGEAIGGIGNAVGGILKGLNINSGARKKAKGDAQLAAYQAKAAAIAAQQPQKKNNTALYIGLAVGAVVIIGLVIFMMKKK